MLDTFSQLAMFFFPSEEILPSPIEEVRLSFRSTTNWPHGYKSVVLIELGGIGEAIVGWRVAGIDLAIGQDRDLTSRLEKVSVPDDARQGRRACRPSWSPSGKPARCRDHHRGLGRSHGTRSHEDAPS